MQAIILAGGKGTRLKPYTTVFPKPLMPIGNYPILDVIIRRLRYYDFKEIILAVGYLKELIKTYFNDGSNWDVNIRYSVEDIPLGTAAPIKYIQNLEDNFLVMNGDGLTNLNYKEFFQFHVESKAICTIAMYNNPTKIESGVLEINDSSDIVDYIEKPTIYHKFSMGIYACNKSILELIPIDQYYDFPHLIKKLIKLDKKVKGYNFNGYWLDIGLKEDYEKAIEVFQERESEFLQGMK